jgi:hypothetical protein
MPDNDFMIQMTRADFDVELLATSGNSALFGALRKGGTQRIPSPHGPWNSHVMGVWHFVAVTAASDAPLRKFQTRQWHIPRFQMADALRQQDHFYKSDEYKTPIWLTWLPIPTQVHGRHQLSFVIEGCGDFRLPESFVKTMKEELHILETAKGRVRERDGAFYLPRAKTAAGNPVEAATEKLLEAIAFEKLTVPRMTAGNFGIYSAYCTFRDFDTSVKMPALLLHELLEAQFEYDAEAIEDNLHDLFMSVQKRLLSTPLWGRGVDITIDQAALILADGMAKLTRPQRVQFILMNGMHGAGLFLPLAEILGFCTEDQYAEYMCQGFAPDSPEEQDRSKEIAYISLYGKLAEQCPNLE